MGIELPAELAGVAARAGVRWPEADEDRLRAGAAAWRQAGEQLTAVTKDADGSANRALSAVTGEAGTAAGRHWQTFVAPDSGHLTSAAKGCAAAADRLDHAADQVGAAKVRIVRHLVRLAQHADVADQAAAAGHPAALAGLHTAVAGTASEVAEVNHALTHSIRLDNGSPDRGGLPAGQADGGGSGAHGPVGGQHGLPEVQGPLGDGPVAGQHGHGLLGAAGPAAGEHALLGAQGPLGDHGALSGANGLVDGGSSPGGGGPGGHGGLLGVQGQASGLGQPGGGLLVGHGLGGHGGPGGLPGPDSGGLPGGQGGLPGGQGPGGLPGGQGGLPGGHGPGDVLGGQGHGGLPGGQGPGGQFGGHGPGGPPDAGQTGPIPVHGTPGGPAQPIGQVLAGHHGHGLPTPPLGTVAQSAAPPIAPPPPTTGPAAPPSAAVPLQAAPPQAVPPPAVAPPMPSAPTPAFGTPAATPPPVSRPAEPLASLGRTGEPPMPPGRAAGGVNQISDVIGVVDGPRSTAQPPARSGVAALPGISAGAGRQGERREALAGYLMYLFPIGQLPKATGRPSRQLPPPAEETDFAAGLRFEPHDHPRSDLLDTDTVTPAPPPHHGFVPADPELHAITEGHDPLGGGRQRDWDHRFLVRPAGDTHAAEYAWPPGELFPEGGHEPGEPVVLPPDTVLDRFGTPEGRVFGEDGTPFALRSLPPDHLDAGYRRYRVVRELPVWRTVSAPWFGQPGGGVRYRAGYPAADLVALGYLTDITKITGTDDDGS